ncbi:MAG: ankyrin repeat domain-containing protein [Endozoicomonadaceae bacterium]|nr:ankyrin repeat domain-containing protein [Endozoicomonadaceae bacterium]
MPYHLNVSDSLFRSGKTTKNLFCAFYLLLLFFCSNAFAVYSDNLYNALRIGNKKIIEQLMQDENIDINIKLSDESNHFQNHCTPLMIVAKYGHTRLAEELIKRGANINAQNERQYSALMYAAGKGHTETADLLIHYGADLYMQDCYGDTPLIHAVSAGSVKTVTSLINKGANLNVCDKNGNTALIHAAVQGKTEMIKYLIGKGFDVNRCNYCGSTALMMAAIHDETETIIYLIEEAAADVTIKDSDDEIALTYYMRYGEKNFIDIVKLLLKRGAYFDNSNPVHMSALQQAFKKFSLEPLTSNTSTTLQNNGTPSFTSSGNKAFCNTESRTFRSDWYRFNIFLMLLEFLKSDDVNNTWSVETSSSGEKSLVFEQKEEHEAHKYILMKLPALKALKISAPPLQDAVKCIIRRKVKFDEIDSLPLPNFQINSIKYGRSLPLKLRLYMELLESKAVNCSASNQENPAGLP